MRGDPRGDEDQEPELRAGDRAPVRKSMAEFLADFDRRLKSHPDLPATGALRLVEERAGGLRRSPHQSAPSATPEPGPTTVGSGEDTAGEPPPLGGGAGEDRVETAAPEGSPEAAAATPGELRRLRGRRRRKHRHRSH